MDFSVIKKRLLDPRVVFAAWIIVALIGALSKVVSGPSRYNNFMIFRGVAEHFFASKPLYGAYPLEYHDMNHYGPLFAFIIAPFQMIPAWLAMPLWVVGMAAVLAWALRKLPVESRMFCIILWIAANDLYTAVLLQQFNIAVAALLVGAYVMIRRKHEGWAALFIVIGTFVKIYGIVGLAFFFFVERKRRFILYGLLWSVVALLLPLVAVSPEYLITQYKDWFADIALKNSENRFCEWTNISFVGAVRKISGSESYSDLWILVPAMVMFMLSYLRWKQFRNTGFQLVMLASLLLFVVVFSSGSESSGYIIAMCGVGIWWAALPRRGVLEWSLLALTLVASYSHILLPTGFRNGIFDHYALRALPYTAIWLYCIFRLWFADFTPQAEKERLDA